MCNKSSENIHDHDAIFHELTKQRKPWIELGCGSCGKTWRKWQKFPAATEPDIHPAFPGVKSLPRTRRHVESVLRRFGISPKLVEIMGMMRLWMGGSAWVLLLVISRIFLDFVA